MSRRGVNKAIVMGRVGSDPKCGFLPNGSAACNFSIATSETWKDKQTGDRQERTEWHKITVFGRLAEIAGEYVKKGSMVYIEGMLRTRKYNRDGVDHYSTEIIADDVQFTGGAGGGHHPASEASNEDENGFDADIPF